MSCRISVDGMVRTFSKRNLRTLNRGAVASIKHPALNVTRSWGGVRDRQAAGKQTDNDEGERCELYRSQTLCHGAQFTTNSSLNKPISIDLVADGFDFGLGKRLKTPADV